MVAVASIATVGRFSPGQEACSRGRRVWEKVLGGGMQRRQSWC